MTHSRPVSTPGPYRRLFKYLEAHRVVLLTAILLSGVAAAATSAYAYLVGPLLRALLLGGGASIGPLSGSAEALVWKIPLLLVGVAAVKAFSQFFQNGLMQQTAFRVIRHIRRDLYEKLLSLPPSFYHRKHSGDLLTRITQDVAQLEFAVSGALANLVRDSLQILALIAVCLRLDARLFAFMFLVTPATLFPILRFAKSLKKVARKTQASVGQLTEAAAELWNNLAVVQAYNAQKLMISRFESQQESYLRLMKKSLFIRGALTPTLEFMGILGAAALIVYGANAVRVEPDLASRLMTFLASALLIYRPLKTVTQTFSQLSQASSSAERIFDVFDADSPPETGKRVEALKTGIEFVDVSATYDGQTEVLKHITLTAPLGSKIGLVGASGAGKTTLFSTLLGFIPLSAGRILWDGADLSTLAPASVRDHIAWVPQEPILFSGTIRDNLLFACPQASETHLWEALRRAHAENFVRERPLGLDAEVGERGGLLSGGQRQRLAIARAFLKQPSVLLLDEPTSALDAASEKEVQAGLHELIKNCTAFIVAHRLSTVRDADILWVMDKGEVIERGTHEELMARKGRYFALVESGLFQEEEKAA